MRRGQIPCIALSLCLAALFAAGVATAQYGGSSVGQPKFFFKDGTTHSGGKCYAVRWNNRDLLLTVFHLLGPDGGFAKKITQSQLNGLIDHIDVCEFGTDDVLATATRSLLKVDIPNDWNRANNPGDMMAFELSRTSRLSPLTISPTLAPMGTRVWVLSHDWTSNANKTDRFAGAVTMSNPAFLMIKLDRALAGASSGSPIVDSNNRLVGMLNGTMDAARTTITAVPSPGIYARLSAEAR